MNEEPESQKHVDIPGLRKLLGLTQKEFATEIGISVIALKKMEAGRAKVSAETKRRIYMATGFPQASSGLLANHGDYSLKHYEHWKSVFPSSEENAWKSLDDIIYPHVLLMLLAATKPAIGGKIKNRLRGVLESWVEWEKKTVKQFALEPQIKNILGGLPVEQKKTLTWGQWRAKQKHLENLKAEMAKNRPNYKISTPESWWGFKDNPSKPDNEPLTLSATVHYGFDAGLFSYPPIIVQKLRSNHGLKKTTKSVSNNQA